MNWWGITFTEGFLITTLLHLMMLCRRNYFVYIMLSFHRWEKQGAWTTRGNPFTPDAITGGWNEASWYEHYILCVKVVMITGKGKLLAEILYGKIWEMVVEGQDIWSRGGCIKNVFFSLSTKSQSMTPRGTRINISSFIKLWRFY